MTGNELRVLRALRRGPLYEGSFGFVLALEAKKVRSCLRSLERQNYVERATEIGPETFRLTESGVEIVEAMTP